MASLLKKISAAGNQSWERSSGYQVFQPKEVAREMNLVIEDVAGIVHLPPTICRLLLHHYNWSKESLEKFYESSDLDAFFAKANISSPLNKHNGADSGKESVGPCVTCCNQIRLTSLSCGHGLRYRCWDIYLATKVVDEGRVYMACPQVGCSIVVDDGRTLSLIKKESVRKRYRRLTIKSFLECNRLLRWCPGADCGRVVKVVHSEAGPVKCKCGTEFCFACVREWHEPVNCRLLQLWLKKCMDDSETSNWISANTKECLRCRIRTMFYSLYATVKKKMAVMQQTNMSWVEVRFLQKAVDVLSQCRRTIIYTYAFAFYLQKDNQSMIIEDNQRDLEHATKQLSEFLERDLENENLISLKQKVQDKSRYVEQRRAALLKHCAGAAEHYFWKFSE